MKNHLQSNIRLKRKALFMTQEQLAEAVGVTVGAVSKWELGQSAPDLSTLIQLADFFQCSIDALIGYEVQNNDREHLLKRIKSACDVKDYKIGIEEAEKALQRYPNSFEIVYQSVILYHASGLEYRNDEHMKRALELGERALLLMEQNQDENISEVDIRHGIAMAYLNLGDEEKAVEIMRRNNPGGHYNYQLGYVLARMEGRIDEALDYMSKAWINNFQMMVALAIGYTNALDSKGKREEVMQFVEWTLQLFPKVTKDGENSVMVKWEAFLQAINGIYAFELGKKELAREYFCRAHKLALQYDRNPIFDMSNINFYYGKENYTIVDGIGSCVSDAIYEACNEQEDKGSLKLWEEICKENREYDKAGSI